MPHPTLSLCTRQPLPFLLVIEGIDFSGKTTLATQLQALLLEQGYRIKHLHDPKGSEHGKVIWETILTLRDQGVDPTTEFFLFLAARNALIIQEISSSSVDIVILDRFIFSTIAYQLTYKSSDWQPFVDLHRFFCKCMPDLCIYCTIDFDRFQRRRQARHQNDLFDQMTQERFQAIQSAYREAFNLNICPVIYVDPMQDDLVDCMHKIIHHIDRRQPLYS